MNVLRCLALLGLSLAGLDVRAAVGERETNVWPAVVREHNREGETVSTQSAGPVLFSQRTNDGGRVSGLRPLWVQAHDAQNNFRTGYFLYPIFSYTQDENTYKWSIFELIRRTDRRAGAGAPQSIFEQRGEFEIWPFWFSRETGDPELSYRGLFPIYGTIKNKLGFDRLSWTLAPFYVQSEKRGAVTTSTPWPFIRVTRGAAHGFGIWPLYNLVERPGVSRDEFFLWPLGYNHVKQPAEDAAPGTPPRHDYGFLPFYARSTGPSYEDVNYVWPFFGHTDRDLPNRYSEVRYFWPLLVQGRGDDRYVNRWGPFYTHSVVKGYDKEWFAWPLVRRAEWTDAEHDLALKKTQFLYFVYWSEQQRSLSRPNAPTAQLTHVWPLFSQWDNGAGRKQWQLLSPLEVFFPGNEKVRQTWTPFFALVRHDQRSPGNERTSILWDAITWERRETEARSEFHLGPLLGVTTQADEKRVAIGNGLFGFKRSPGAGWRMFWLDFPSKSATKSTASR